MICYEKDYYAVLDTGAKAYEFLRQKLWRIFL